MTAKTDALYLVSTAKLKFFHQDELTEALAGKWTGPLKLFSLSLVYQKSQV